MKRSLRKIAAGLVIAFGLLAAAAFFYLPYQGFGGETFVRFAHGTSSRGMAMQLKQTGVIRYGWPFLVLRALHPSAKLQAGEYRFNASASVPEVFHRLAIGDIYYFDFTVPEGSNIFDIARLLDATGSIPGEEFLHAASDPSPIHDLAPAAKTLEGYLFPSTYRLSHDTTAAELCSMMTAQFRHQWKRLNPGGTGVHQIVTLASLVEKETAAPAERSLIAGVFTNRLNKSMRLECDPTVIYAGLLDNRYRGVIHRSDLASRNPYNTYQIAGLPPGPIANPGADAIAAALHPAETSYLFFVAKPAGGGHQFSSTLAEHEQAVREYRHARKAL